MEIIRGLISVAPTKEQWEEIKAGKLTVQEVKLTDGVRTFERDGKTVEVLNFQIAERKEGEEKSTYHSVAAFGKQMRIIMELGEGHPVTLATTIKEHEGFKNHTAQIVQDDKTGVAAK